MATGEIYYDVIDGYWFLCEMDYHINSIYDWFWTIHSDNELSVG